MKATRVRLVVRTTTGEVFTGVSGVTVKTTSAGQRLMFGTPAGPVAVPVASVHRIALEPGP